MFWLSSKGWWKFSRHFRADDTCGIPLKLQDMANRRAPPDAGGHAVVMTACSPESLTFLNSYGNDWGDGGSFSVESREVLEVMDAAKFGVEMQFYDVFWVEDDLTTGERRAYEGKVDEHIRRGFQQFSSAFELEVQCPFCGGNFSSADFRGNVRRATCPFCRKFWV